jgi:hypothetical protein
MDSYALVALVLWPATVLLAALLNMLVSWTFSWGELILDALAGFLIGSVFYVAYDGRPDAAVSVLLVLSHGLFGVLHVAGVGLVADPKDAFLLSAFWTVLGTTLSGALDRGAVALGAEGGVGGFFLSLLIFLIKAPFALVTSSVGLLLWLIGLFRSLAPGGKVGFAGGIFWAEWNNTSTSGEWTTSFGVAVHSWKNAFSLAMAHELYHTRQYIYLRDWLMPFWVLGEVVRLIARNSNKANPIEAAAYNL